MGSSSVMTINDNCKIAYLFESSLRDYATISDFMISYAPFHQLSSLYCHLATSEISEKTNHTSNEVRVGKMAADIHQKIIPLIGVVCLQRCKVNLPLC